MSKQNNRKINRGESKSTSWRLRSHLHWSVEVFPGEAHDYESQRRHPVKPPLGEAEVVDEDADVCWDDVANRQKTLKQARPRAETST